MNNIYVRSEYHPYDKINKYFIYHPEFGYIDVDYNTYLKIIKMSVLSDQMNKTIDEKMKHIDEFIRCFINLRNSMEI